MAVGTCAECGQKKELGSRTICETCRKRIQRANKKGMVLPPVLVDAKNIKPYQIEPEAPEEWLARRVEETGSKKWQWIKTGNPPGSQPDIKVPQKWELSDIDQALSYRGQWGERELESKP